MSILPQPTCPWPVSFQKLLHPKGRTWHLALFNFMWSLLFPSFSLPRDLRMMALSLNILTIFPLLPLTSLVPSALLMTVCYITFYRSLISMLNSKGPIADFCVTAQVTEHYP